MSFLITNKPDYEYLAAYQKKKWDRKNSSSLQKKKNHPPVFMEARVSCANNE
jgi:hypothetical protein